MKVFHPDIEGLFREIPKGDLDDWLEQGWLKSEPKSKVTDEAPATS